MYTLTGIVKVKKDTQQISDRFQKREFVVTDNTGQYPQHCLFQLTQDKCNLLDDINEGEEVNVSFFLRGREWTSPQGEVRYFNSLDVWKLEKGAGASAPAAAPISAAEPLGDGGADDDLPF